MKTFIMTIAVAVGALLPIPAIAQSLHLVCVGGGEGNRAAVTSVYGQDNHGNSAWGQVIGRRAVPFDDQVNIELNEDGTGKVRMPRVMLPPLHGGSDGWFTLKNIKRSDDEITGTVQVNFINSPKLRLDRTTGRISIVGKAGNYSGECQPYSPATVARKF